MAVLAHLYGAAPLLRGSSVIRFRHRLELAALAARAFDAAAQLAVFLWMAGVVGFFGIVAAGFLLA